MGKGLGGIVGSIAGGAFGGPVGAMIGGGVGGMIDGPSGNSKNSTQSTNLAVASQAGNIGLSKNLDNFLMAQGEKGIEHAQGMMNDWETAFGSIESNLSDYYNNLDPAKFSQQAKTQYADSLDKQLKQFNETMTQRGLQTSGQREQLEKEAMFNKAQANASIDMAAPEQVAQMKQSWYNQGIGQKNLANQTMVGAIGNQANYASLGEQARANANTGLANAYNGQANMYEDRANRDNSSSRLGAVSGLLGGGSGGSSGGGIMGSMWQMFGSV
jgi:hypothetical protein